MTDEPFVIASKLVHYLRAGVKRALSERIEDLAVTVEQGQTDPDRYAQSVAEFEHTRALFEYVGVADSAEETDLALDLLQWPAVALRALEIEHSKQVRRLQDAELDGVRIPPRDVPALGQLVDAMRKRTGAKVKHPHGHELLWRPAPRRRRGDG